MGARYSALVQTGPHRGNPGETPRGCFPGIERPSRGVDHPPLPNAEVKERVELFLYSPSGPSWPVKG